MARLSNALHSGVHRAARTAAELPSSALDLASTMRLAGVAHTLLASPSMPNLGKLVGVMAVAAIAALGGCSSGDGSPASSRGGARADDGGADTPDSSTADANLPDAASTAPGAPSGLAVVAVPVVTEVTTFAGSGAAASSDGTGGAASFNVPTGVAVDAAGNLYVSEYAGNRIRKVTAAGVVTTLAGSGAAAFADGTGAAASFNGPTGVALDAQGAVYVADGGNHRIRKVTPMGEVTTLAGSGTAAFAEGIGAAASFDRPTNLAADPAGNLYVADAGNERIRKVTPARAVTTLAGSGTAAFADGTGGAASFSEPSGVALDAAGTILVVDLNNYRIRKITAGAVVTTLAGSGAFTPFSNGTGAAATFFNSAGIAVDGAGNAYVADFGNRRIRRVTPAGAVTTLAGSGAAFLADGTGSGASFSSPDGIAVDALGKVYVTDSSSHRIRKLVSVGIGELVVTWNVPSGGAAGYAASATAAGHATRTCVATGLAKCTLSGLTSGVPYSVSVIATSAAGASAPSAGVTATPN
jgi:serine/threonine protein kinase, bacterial